MNPKLTGNVTLIFIRGGVSAKTGNPYLQVSNGRKEFFCNVKKLEIDESTFNSFEEGDAIDLEVEVTVGSDGVNVVDIT